MSIDAASQTNRLRVNLILPVLSMAGGIKSFASLTEQMVRLGHTINILHPAGGKPWPRPWRLRQLFRRLSNEWQLIGKPRHYLHDTSANLIDVPHTPIRAGDVPDGDVVIATWWETAEWIKDWPASKGVKVYFIRGYEVFGGARDRVHATYRLPYRKLVIATWLQRLMRDKFDDDEAVLIPNGVDHDHFNAPPRDKSAVPTVGMLYGRGAFKGAATAFDALRLVQQTMPNLQVVCFGQQPVDPSLVRPDNFEYHLRPSQELIPQLYSRCDCWLVPSKTEGFGMPGLEAAACRCPIVSTRCGGPQDYIDDGASGHLVDVGAPQQMAERIIDVLNLDAPRWRSMSQASYDIAARFDWQRTAELLQRALCEITGDHSAAAHPAPGSAADRAQPLASGPSHQP